MKRIIAFLFALMMIMALCACGAKEDASAAPEVLAEPPVVQEAPDAPEAPAAVASDEPAEAASGEPAGTASGEASSAPEDVQVQDLNLFPMEGYDKTFAGYIEWVCAALASQAGNPNLESELAAVRAVTEDSYNPEAMPFSMQIRFGLITSYEDYLG